MWHNLGRHLAGLMIVMFLVAAMVFFLTRLAPGDPASLMLGDQATAEDIAHLRQVYGLDKPVLVQFVLWLKEIVSGNLGQSIFLQRPVTQAIAERAEPTFFLALFSVSIAALVGIPAGIVVGGLARSALSIRSSAVLRCWPPTSRASGSA